MDDKPAIDRRTAIKRGVAAGAAAGVVWTAPKIEGLSLRPNYATAMSTAPGLLCVDVPAVSPMNGTSVFAPPAFDICSGSGDIQIQLGKDFVNNPRRMRVQVRAGNVGGNALPTSTSFTPASAEPAGFDAATTGTPGYRFQTNNMAYNGAFQICIPYNCS